MMSSRQALSIAAAAAVSLGGSLALPSRAEAGLPVFDVSNYSENILQAARALEQINNQVRSLQNEAAMIEAMQRNLQRIEFPELSKMSSALDHIDSLMDKAEAIGFDTDRLDERFRAMFPDADRASGVDQRAAAAKARLDAAMDSFRHSMSVQSGVVSNIEEDAGTLRELALRSDQAAGGLQAQQATNQLLALAAKQQLQLQALMASEFRSEAIERARRLEAESEGQAATRRFLGTGKAYTPLRP